MSSWLAGPRAARLIVAAGVVLVVCLAAACGEDDAARVTTSPTVVGEPKGAVLIVVAPKDFQDKEFAAVRDAVAAAGYEPVVANTDGGTSTSMDGATIDADISLADAATVDYDGVVLIGGPGAEAYWDDATVHEIVQRAAADGRPLGAICLAPVTLARAGVLQGKKATVWPDNRGDLSAAGCDVRDDPVVVDGLIVTGNGPDAAGEFAQAFVTALSAARSGPTPVD
jgi:protease I